MRTAYITTGTLHDDWTITLDEALPLGQVKVRLAIELLKLQSLRGHDEIIAEIWDRQQKRGFRPPTRAEVDADLAAERDSWNE